MPLTALHRWVGVTLQGSFWKDRNLFRTDESLTVILFVSFDVQMFAIVTGNVLPALSRAAVCTHLDFFFLSDPEGPVAAVFRPLLHC